MRAVPGDGQEDRALEILEEVSLDYFTAEPSAISPFGASSLRWKVTGPSTGFKVRLEGTDVAKAGSRGVQPAVSHTYRLHAYAGGYSKFLGNATVNVNLGRCTSNENATVAQLMKYGLQRAIDADAKLYFRIVKLRDAQGRDYYAPSEPEIIITPHQIRFLLKLGTEIDNFPNPEIDIDASFGLTVATTDSITVLRDYKVVPINDRVEVSISVPWYAWLIPGAPIGLGIALDMAKDRATKGIRESIPGLVDEAIIDRIAEPAGMEPHSVRILTGGFNNQGIVEVTFCPVERPPVAIE